MSTAGAVASLKPALVLGKTRCRTLSEVTRLNLWGCGLNEVSLLREMPALRVVSLSLNAVRGLGEFSCLPQLEELYLRGNDVSDLAEVVHLQGLRRLHTLWLAENPCSEEKNAVMGVSAGVGGERRDGSDGNYSGNSEEAEESRWYRTFVLRMLPQLRKLDNMIITEEERARALAANSHTLHMLHRRAHALAKRASVGEGDGVSQFKAAAASSGGVSRELSAAADPLSRSYIVMEGRPIRGLPVAAGLTSASEEVANLPQEMKSVPSVPDFDPRAHREDSNAAAYRRSKKPLSPPQILALRVESEINPLDFLGDEARENGGRKLKQLHRHTRAAALPKDGIDLTNEGGHRRAGGEVVRQVSPTATAPASSSACDVALMLLEQMDHVDLERVMAAARRRLRALEMTK